MNDSWAGSEIEQIITEAVEGWETPEPKQTSSQEQQLAEGFNEVVKVTLGENTPIEVALLVRSVARFLGAYFHQILPVDRALLTSELMNLMIRNNNDHEATDLLLIN